MARIPDNELPRLKEEVSVQRLVEAAGIALKRAGKDWLAGHGALNLNPHPLIDVHAPVNAVSCEPSQTPVLLSR